MFKLIINSLKRFFIKLLIIFLPFLIFKFMPLRYKLECKLFFLNSVNRFYDIPSEQIMGLLVLFIVFLLFIIGGEDDDNHPKK
jgi:hypothetical protein